MTSVGHAPPPKGNLHGNTHDSIGGQDPIVASRTHRRSGGGGIAFSENKVKINHERASFWVSKKERCCSRGENMSKKNAVTIVQKDFKPNNSTTQRKQHKGSVLAVTRRFSTWALGVWFQQICKK